MATASITYDYPYINNSKYKYGIESLSSSDVSTSTPNSYINKFWWYRFNTSIPKFKKIKLIYTFWCDKSSLITSYDHGLYYRTSTSGSWTLFTKFRMTRQTSDDSNYAYMAKYELNIDMATSVRDICIEPTSGPNGSYTWSSVIDIESITLQESFTDNAVTNSDYLTNVFIGNSIKTRSSSEKVEDYLKTLYKNMNPKVLTLSVDNELVNATEVHVNIDGEIKKVTQSASVATGTWSWTSSSFYDGIILFSFTAENNCYGINTIHTGTNSHIHSKFIVDSTTNQTTEISSTDVISGLTLNRKYYILIYVVNSSGTTETASVDVLMYPLINIKDAVGNLVSITGTKTVLSYNESGTMRQNENGLIKLDIATLPSNMYFMMYDLKVSSSSQDGYMAIYDSYGNQIYNCDDNDSGWADLEQTHPTLAAKSTNKSRDPLIITKSSNSDGPFYVEFRKLNLSGTSMMNYTIEWGSL